MSSAPLASECCALVQDWLDCVAANDMGADLWHNTPLPLIRALVERVGAMGKPVPKLVEPAIVAVASAASAPVLLGAIERNGILGLASPQSVLRNRLADGWRRVEVGPAQFLIGTGVCFDAAAQAQAARIIDRVQDRLGVSARLFRYFVPGSTDFRDFALCEARLGHHSALAGWGWTDPHGGDVVSRDPLDAHEISHAVANSLEGWPCQILREGLAECFAPPVDAVEWYRCDGSPTPEKVWSSRPGGMRAWYSESAILVTAIIRQTGLETFKRMWVETERDDDFFVFLQKTGLSASSAERDFAIVRTRCRDERLLTIPSGISLIW